MPKILSTDEGFLRRMFFFFAEIVPTNKTVIVDYLKLKNYIGMMKCFFRNHCRNHLLWIDKYWCCWHWFNRKRNLCNNKKGRETYHSWTPADWFKISKYVAENGNTAAVRKFKAEFLRLNESTVCEFKKKYNTKIANAAKEKRKVSKLILKYSSQIDRPLLLGHFDSRVQTYIKQLSNRGSVANRAIANTTAQALLIQYPKLVGEIDVCSFFWAQRFLFRRMGFKERWKTSSA